MVDPKMACTRRGERAGIGHDIISRSAHSSLEIHLPILIRHRTAFPSRLFFSLKTRHPGTLTKTPESSGTSSSGRGPGGIITRSHIPDHSSEGRVRVDDGVRREGLFRRHGS